MVRLLSKSFVSTLLIICTDASTTTPLEDSVVTHPTYPSRRYTLGEVLGEGRWGIVHRVRLMNGDYAAMKSDKLPVRLSDGDTERDVLREISSLSFVGPRLIDSFAIPTEAEHGRRYTVMDLVGPSVKRHMSSNRLARLPEHTAASIMLQVIDAASQLRDVGYLHNDIHYDNVAFATPTSRDRTLLIDFGNAKRVPSPVMDALITREFGVDHVLNEFVLREYPRTDPSWFRWAVSKTSDDKHIRDFISNRSWKPISKIYIRNARIVARMQDGLTYSNLPLGDSINELISNIVVPADRDVDSSWFRWALQQGNHHIDGYLRARTDRFTEQMQQAIRATRSLVQYMIEDELVRKDFTRIVKCFLQMIGCSLDTNTEFADSWFWSLMQTKKDQMAAAFTCHSETGYRALDEAWDVMHGANPNLLSLRSIFEDHLAQHGHQYTGTVIY